MLGIAINLVAFAALAIFYDIKAALVTLLATTLLLVVHEFRFMSMINSEHNDEERPRP